MIYLFWIIQLTIGTMFTVYETTNIATVTKRSSSIAVETITLWSTSVHQPDTTPSPTGGRTTTITSTVLTTTTIIPDDEISLMQHNAKRALHHDTPALIRDDAIVANAQRFAGSYNCNGTLIHSGDGYGENLALGYTISAAVNAWYDEIELYDYNDPSFAYTTGHFTQLVWKNTTRVGCAYKDCGPYYGQYTVCQYYPPGNWAGQFADNVLPLK